MPADLPAPAPRAVPPAAPDGAPLRVAVEATALLGTRTGVGRFCELALQALAARPDVALSAFAVSWRRRHGLQAAVPAGVAVRQRPMPARPLLHAWAHHDWPPAEWFVGPADVVHGTNFVVPPTRGAARVVTVHDLTTVRFPEMCDAATLVFPAMVRRAVAGGAWVHTPSQAVADEVVAELGVDPGRVRAVHHGLPPAATPAPGPLDAVLTLPEGTRRYVLSVGTVEPRKDLPGLVAAFDRLAADHPDVALVVAGPDGWGADAFHRALAAARHASRVVRTGYLSDRELARVLGAAAVLAYPSRYEGFGFPPLEAMAAGVPVVATTAGALPEVVGDGAVLVPVGDRDALAGALDAVLRGDGVEELVARGRRRAASYSWEACAQGLVDLYRQARRGAAVPGGRGD
jgi:glycosyltransferase involved in cell wall biosynthesis